jgi:gamma-glutamylcyclotransferase (GGCT)/AIG2-like uncharacterized protein YtfP
MTYIFVYGTLKTGLRNHNFMEQAIYIGEAATKNPVWHLVDIMPDDDCDYMYPRLTRGGKNQVHGEVYKVDAQMLAQIDELEDVDREYRREKISLTNNMKADTYVSISDDIEMPFSSYARQIEPNTYTWSDRHANYE